MSERLLCISNMKGGHVLSARNKFGDPDKINFSVLNLKNDLTFFKFRISGFWSKVCYVSTSTFVFFADLLWICMNSHDYGKKNSKFWLFFNLNGLYWWETDKVKFFWQKWKVWFLKIFFYPPSAIKAKKLTTVCLFKIESVLSKNKKEQISVQISQICTEIFFFLFLLTNWLKFEQKLSCQF